MPPTYVSLNASHEVRCVLIAGTRIRAITRVMLVNLKLCAQELLSGSGGQAYARQNGTINITSQELQYGTYHLLKGQPFDIGTILRKFPGWGQNLEYNAGQEYEPE